MNIIIILFIVSIINIYLFYLFYFILFANNFFDNLEIDDNWLLKRWLYTDNWIESNLN